MNGAQDALGRLRTLPPSPAGDESLRPLGAAVATQGQDNRPTRTVAAGRDAATASACRPREDQAGAAPWRQLRVCASATTACTCTPSSNLIEPGGRREHSRKK